MWRKKRHGSQAFLRKVRIGGVDTRLVELIRRRQIYPSLQKRGRTHDVPKSVSLVQAKPTGRIFQDVESQAS